MGNIKCKECGFEFYGTKDIFTKKFLKSGLCITCYHKKEAENGKA